MKRPSESARWPMMSRPRRRSSSPSGVRGPCCTMLRSEPANERIGVSELLISCESTRMRRCHASRSSACRVRLTSVSSTSWCGTAILAEGGAAEFPAGGTGPLEHAGRLALEAVGDAQFPRVACRCSWVAGGAKELLAAAIHEHQPLVRIEGEHGGVDLGHDGAEQGARLEGVEPMAPQHLGEAVGLHIKEAEVVIGAGAAGAEREVALAHGGEEVGGGLDRADDVVVQHARGRRRARPTTKQCAGPLCARAVGAESRGGRARRTSAGSAAQNAMVTVRRGYVAMGARARTAPAGDRGRCGSGPAPSRRRRRCRRRARAPSG